MYLKLLKGALTRELFPDTFAPVPRNVSTFAKRLRWSAFAVFQRLLDPLKLKIVHTAGRIGETMIGMGAMNNLEWCVNQVLDNDVPGDLCETGIWRGGACIYMRALLHVRKNHDKRIWACDSFEGLPKPKESEFPADKGSVLWSESALAVSVEQVKANFAKYGLLDDRTTFVKGFFSDTMPGLAQKIDRLAVLRLDGDMYESTIVVLEHLYPKLSAGGFVIVDDYGMLPECDRAVHDFRARHGVTEPIQIIGYVDGKHQLGAYWKKAS